MHNALLQQHPNIMQKSSFCPTHVFFGSNVLKEHGRTTHLCGFHPNPPPPKKKKSWNPIKQEVWQVASVPRV